MGFCVYIPLPPLRGQHTVLCHPRWLPTSGLTEFAVCWGGAGFEPRTTDLQSGALPLSHLSSLTEPPLLLTEPPLLLTEPPLLLTEPPLLLTEPPLLLTEPPLLLHTVFIFT